MQKRNLLLGLIALLVVIACTWGVLEIHALASGQTTTGSRPIAASPTGLTSLYLTGSLVIPTVKVSTSTASCDPKNIPDVALDSANGVGATAITPHLCSIPTFTEQDVRAFLRTRTSFSGMRISQTSPDYIITRILFITNGVANDPKGLNADTGPSDPNLIVCYVEVYGNFTVDGVHQPRQTTPRPQTILHHGQMVFDGVTGKILVTGVTA